MTPARHPLAHVQDTHTNSATPTKSLTKRLTFLSPRHAHKDKRKAKRYSVPAYVLRTFEKEYRNSLTPIPEFLTSEKGAMVKDNVSATKNEESSYEKNVEEFVEKVVGGIVTEMKKVLINLNTIYKLS